MLSSISRRLAIVLFAVTSLSASAQQAPQTNDQTERQLIQRLFASNQTAAALAQLQRHAFAKAPWAQLWLGDLYRQGKAVPRSLVHAVDWYGQAAYAGNLEAQSRLSSVFCHSKLRSVVNGAKCNYWLNLLAKRGFYPAQLELATIQHGNRFGLGNRSAAKEWAKSATQAKNKDLAAKAKDLLKVLEKEEKTINKKANRLDGEKIEKLQKKDTHTIRVQVFKQEYALEQFLLNTQLKDLYRYDVHDFHIVSLGSFKSIEDAEKALSKFRSQQKAPSAVIVSWQQILANL